MHEITSYFITQNDINLLTLSLVLKVETSDLASFSLFVFFQPPLQIMYRIEK